MSWHAELSLGGLRGRIATEDASVSDRLEGTLTLLPGAVAAPADLREFGRTHLVHVVRVRNGQQSYEPIHQVVNGVVTALPIDFGPASDELYLILYGSGLGKTNPSVSAKIGGADSIVGYAGAQGTFTGLDQFNLLLP